MAENSRTETPRSNLMPHEYPKLVVSDAPNLHSNNIVDSGPYSSVTKTRTKMAAPGKENSTVDGGANLKAPIPEHIHDSNANSFYKLGRFLGKV